MEAACSSETVAITYETTWCHGPVVHNLNFHRPETFQGSIEDTDNQTFMCRRHEPMRLVGEFILLMDSINMYLKYQKRVINKTAGKTYRRVH
jgi:hypothetical protein